MRECPACEGTDRKVVVPDYLNFELVACRCGMHYVDSAALNQQWFDEYYATIYRTDDKPYSDARLNSLADFVTSYEPRSVLDIGGMDGELQQRLQIRGLTCDVSGVGDENRNKYDAVILSHTLEHIYDMPAMMRRIQRNLGNRLFIEVPIWNSYDDLSYDHHWQHINKFTAHKLEATLVHYGFQIGRSVAIPDYREYHCHRVMAWRAA